MPSADRPPRSLPARGYLPPIVSRKFVTMTMQLIKVSAQSRPLSGKGPSRRLRVEGMIPAVAYSKGNPAQQLAVSPTDVVSALTSDHGRNSVVEIEIDGKAKLKAMIKEYQYHPVSRQLLHADFVQVEDNVPVVVEVPLRLTGKAKGIVLGGTLRQVYRDVPVRCLPSAIPVELSHDITELGIDGHVAASDIAVPSGVEIQLPPRRTLAAIFLDKKAKAEEEAAAAAANPAAAPAKK